MKMEWVDLRNEMTWGAIGLLRWERMRTKFCTDIYHPVQRVMVDVRLSIGHRFYEMVR